MARGGKFGLMARGSRAGVLVSFLLVFAGSPLAQTPQDPHAAADQAIRRLGLQTELPRDPEAMPFRIRLPPELLWVLAAAGVGLLLYMLSDMLPALGFAARGQSPEDDEEVGGSLARPPEQVLAAADDLARQGRFVDAMHVLLLQGLADIRRYLGEQHADSLTSREILRSTKLSNAGREPLRDIIARVEWTYFGRHPAEREDYAACRASFDSLARALHGKTA